jgi:hypothetical protein
VPPVRRLPRPSVRVEAATANGVPFAAGRRLVGGSSAVRSKGVVVSALPLSLAVLAFAAAAVAAPVQAQSYLARPQAIGGNPGPAHNYVCPNADGGPALDCFLDAVRHLYTICKNVKNIEILEFGYEKSDEGTNPAKSESCVHKQRTNIARPFQAALKEATISRQAVEKLRELHAYWIASLAALKWRPEESAEDYLVRTGMVYPSIDEQADSIRALLTEMREHVAARRAKARR